MNSIIADGIERVKDEYGDRIAGWCISPTPSYFDCGEGPSFEICPVDINGNDLDTVFVCDGTDSEWECYKMFVDLFGEDEPVIRSASYVYIY